MKMSLQLIDYSTWKPSNDSIINQYFKGVIYFFTIGAHFSFLAIISFRMGAFFSFY